MYGRNREPMPGCLVITIASTIAIGVVFWGVLVIGAVAAIS